MSYKSKNIQREPRVIIIGGGLAGITHAVALKKQLGFENFSIYEQASDLGGTWRDNTYPGCACDTHTHWYSLSTDLNPYWDRTHVMQPGLLSYWQDIARKYQIYPHAVFETEVLSAQWKASKQRWIVEFQDVKTKRKWTEEAEVVISAIGILCVPHYPEGTLSKVKTVFKGEHFHSARWDHSIDLGNKRVAVIGNGCSAAQFLPPITEDSTTEVINFCRSPTWIVPGNQGTYSETQKWIFAHVPFVMRLYRWYLMSQFEYIYSTVIGGGKENWIRRRYQQTLKDDIKAKAP